MKQQLKEIILQIGIEQAEFILAELKEDNNLYKQYNLITRKKGFTSGEVDYKESLSQNKEAEAREFLVGIFNRMKVRVEKDYPNFVFYDVDELGTIFEQDAKYKRLWISNTHVWSIMESKFGYNYPQAKELITDTVEDILNWRGYTLGHLMHNLRYHVEDILNWEGFTPIDRYNNWSGLTPPKIF